MIDCDECGNRISDRAAACPHCGAPIVTTGRGIKGHQVLGLVVMVSGLALFLATSDPGWNAIGGMLTVLGFIAALL